jgi:hypothetical protein
MANLLLKNGRFLTFNAHDPLVDVLLIEEGLINYAGAEKEIGASGRTTEVIDLNGACVLPGITDAHIHLLEYGLSLQRVNCETASRQECVLRVKERVASTASGEWVLGHGWNHNIWTEGKGAKELLDVFSLQNPIYLTHKSLHSGWANSAALNAAGISLDTRDPEGGLIERDADGVPTGIVYESAMRLVERAIPSPNPAQRRSALENAQAQLLSMGITSVHDFDVWDCFLTLNDMQQDGTLKIRVVKSIPFPKLDEAIATGLRSGRGSGLLHVGWLKLFSDGALGPQTAAMLQPYEGSSSTGMLFLKSEEIIEIGGKAMTAGISLAVHAIGDRANREVLNGFEQLRVQGLFNLAALKPRIEHVQIILPEDARRLAAIGITASMQPIHAVSDRDMADRYWGKRCANAYAWKSALNAGAALVFGSDAPVESPNPFWGISAALERTVPANQPKRDSWYPQQCLTIRQALDAYIPAPQKAAGLGDRAGRLQKGCFADLVIFKENLLEQAASEFIDLAPAGVMSAGKWVHRNL